MKGNIIIILILTACVAGFVWFFKYSGYNLHSKVLVSKTKIVQVSDNRIIIHIPIAAVPVPEKQNGLVSCVGKVVHMHSNPDDLSSPFITVLSKENDVVVLSNVPYVHSLEYFYLNRDVELKGKWGKETVINGNRYKSFWVEDYGLVE